MLKNKKKTKLNSVWNTISDSLLTVHMFNVRFLHSPSQLVPSTKVIIKTPSTHMYIQGHIILYILNQATWELSTLDVDNVYQLQMIKNDRSTLLKKKTKQAFWCKHTRPTAYHMVDPTRPLHTLASAVRQQTQLQCWMIAGTLNVAVTNYHLDRMISQHTKNTNKQNKSR